LPSPWQKLASFGFFQMTEETESEKGEQVRFMTSPQIWKYLGWLSRNTLLGKTEHEVARQILATKLSKMKRKKYRPEET
jgi:hypothetical protein